MNFHTHLNRINNPDASAFAAASRCGLFVASMVVSVGTKGRGRVFFADVSTCIEALQRF